MTAVFLLKTLATLVKAESGHWSTEDELHNTIRPLSMTLEEKSTDSTLEWWKGIVGIAGVMLLMYTLYSFVREHYNFGA